MSKDTGPAKLPGLPILKTSDQALARWAQAVAEHLEVRAGARGNPLERAVTVRELEEFNRRGSGQAGAFAQGQPLVIVEPGGGVTVVLTIDQFTQRILDSELFKDLRRKLDDPNRFDYVPEAVRKILLLNIAEEAAKRGADISLLESKVQTATDSLAFRVQEVTAAVQGAAAGVRETTYTSANANRATAGKIAQLVATLDGTGSATAEESLVVIADRTTGLRSQYMLKLNAGKAVVGFGLMASEDPQGNTTSDFIINADNFAITGTGINPVVPFGVDTRTNTIYMNGQVKINASGPTLEQISKSITLTASSTVFKVGTGGNGTPGAITLTVTMNNGLTGSPSFSVIDGAASLSGSGLTRTLSFAGMSTDRVTVRAILTVGTYSYMNDLTIYKAYDGTKGADGLKGDTGFTGQRGSVTRYGSGSWNDAVATSLLPNGIAVMGDTVTLSTATSAVTKYWSGSYTAGWLNPGVVLDGNLLVKGTVSADSLVAGNNNTGVSIAGANPVTNAQGTAITNGVYVYQNSNSLYGLYASNRGGGAGYLYSDAGYTLDALNVSGLSSAAGISATCNSGTAVLAKSTGGYAVDARGNVKIVGNLEITGALVVNGVVISGTPNPATPSPGPSPAPPPGPTPPPAPSPSPGTPPLYAFGAVGNLLMLYGMTLPAGFQLTYVTNGGTTTQYARSDNGRLYSAATPPPGFGADYAGVYYALMAVGSGYSDLYYRKDGTVY